MPATIDKYSWYDVSPEVKNLLILASEHWEDHDLAEQYINQALEKAEKNTNVLIGAYRFFFYKGQSVIALEIAEKVLQHVRSDENLPMQWEQLKPILISRQHEPAIRLFLHAYSAVGFLKARLGQ